jgi:Tfp pilus assembly protein PilE
MSLMPKSLKATYVSQRGFSYAEMLLSVMLLAILLVPAMQALNSAIAGGSSNIAARQLNLRNKMEEVLSKPYHNLYAETSLPGGNTTTSISTSLSDASGAADRRVVVLYRFDTSTNALSATETGVLYVSVYYEAEGSTNALNTLVGRWW